MMAKWCRLANGRHWGIIDDALSETVNRGKFDRLKDRKKKRQRGKKNENDQEFTKSSAVLKVALDARVSLARAKTKKKKATAEGGEEGEAMTKIESIRLDWTFIHTHSQGQRVGIRLSDPLGIDVHQVRSNESRVRHAEMALGILIQGG